MQNMLPKVALYKSLKDKILSVFNLAMTAYLCFDVVSWMPYPTKHTDKIMYIFVILFVSFFVACTLKGFFNFTDYLKADSQGLYQRDGFKEQSVRWTEIGAYAFDGNLLALLNQANNEIILQIDLQVQPIKGGWDKVPCEKFKSFVLAKLSEFQIEQLPIEDEE